MTTVLVRSRVRPDQPAVTIAAGGDPVSWQVRARATTIAGQVGPVGPRASEGTVEVRNTRDDRPAVIVRPAGQATGAAVRIWPDGTIESAVPGAPLILTSPDGTGWAITVDDAGQLHTAPT